MGDVNTAVHGLRGVAAIMVLLFHWYQIFPAAASRLETVLPAELLLNPVTPLKFGWLGVPLFFVLSGYILGAQVIRQPFAVASLARFWRRRFLRIYPAVWFHLLCLLLVSMYVPKLIAPEMWATLHWQFSLWINMPPNMQAPISNVMWTLPIELSFYIVLPFIGLMTRRFNWMLLLAASLIITLMWRFYVMHWQSVPHYTAVLPWLDLLPGTLFTFMVGYSLNFLPTRNSSRGRVWGLGLATLVFMALLQWQLIVGELYWTGHWALAVWPPCIAASLGAMVYFCSQPGASIRWLNNPAMIWLGNISFGVYLWHYPIMRSMFYLFEDGWGSVPMSVLALPVALLLTLPIATLSYRFIERPLMGWR